MASSGRVKGLEHCVVSPRQLQCAEFCFRVSMNFDVSAKDDPGLLQLKQILTALLNTSGGIVELNADKHNYPGSQKIDKWMQKFEDTLKRFIPMDIHQNCITVKQYSYRVVIYVKKSHKIITVNAIYIRGIGRTTAVTDIDSINQVMHRCASATHPFQMWDSADASYGRKIEENEGPNIEYKMWESVKTFEGIDGKNTYIARLQEDRTQKTLFAFPNEENGGRLIIGVKTDTKSDKNVLLGQIVSVEDQRLMTKFIAQFLLKDQYGVRRLWGDGSRIPEMGKDWTIQFIPLSHGPAGKRRVVIIIEFKHFPGGVWERYPESYFVSDDGYVHQMTLKQWKAAVTRNTLKYNKNNQLVSNSTHFDKDLSEVPPKMNRALITLNPKTDKQVEDTKHTLGASNAPLVGLPAPASESSREKHRHGITVGHPKGRDKATPTQNSESKMKTMLVDKPICSTQINEISTYANLTIPDNIEHSEVYENIDVRGCPTFSDVTIDTNNILENTDHLSWEELARNRKPRATTSSYDLERNAHKLVNKSSIFNMASPTNISPDIGTIVRGTVCNRTEMDEALNYVHQYVRFKTAKKSFGLASSIWTSNVRSAVERPQPRNHRLDIFVVNEIGAIELWAIVENHCNISDVWEYLFISGRLTKKRILHNQIYTHIDNFLPSLYIDCHVYRLGFGAIEPASNIFPTDKHSSNVLSCKSTLTHTLKTALAKCLLEHRTRIRSLFGDDNSIIMTTEQMDIIMALGFSKFNYIEGPPGSGKTYLALHICQRMKRYGYVCTTKAFKQFLLYQQLEKTQIFLVQTDKDLEDHINEMKFDNIDILVFDDFQNVYISRTNLENFFEYIAQICDIKLVVFGDSRYQNFNSDTFMNDTLATMQEFCIAKNFHMTHKVLSHVHRNTHVVTSFLRSNFANNPEYPEHEQITCSHTETGDDVEIRHFEDMWSNTPGNSFVKFIIDLTNSTLVVANKRTSYEPRDVALLVDTNKTNDDVKILSTIFEDQLGTAMSVQDAATFPLTGITIDALDNFLGFDRKICVLVACDDIMKSCKPHGRSLANPRYRTFVASRGISRVVFVIERPPDTAIARKFGMNELIIRQKFRRLWHQVQNESIKDVCFVNVGGRTSLLYISGKTQAIGAVSLEGETIDILTAPPGMKYPQFIVSSADGANVILAGWDDTKLGPWLWTSYRVQTGGRLDKDGTCEMDEKPLSVCQILDGEILVLARKNLRKISSSGQQLSCTDVSMESKHKPRLVTASSDSSVIICVDSDECGGCVRMLTGGDAGDRKISNAGLSRITAICIDTTGHWLIVGDGNRDIYKLSIDGSRIIRLIKAPCHIFRLRLHEGGHLIVATSRGLLLYDIAAALT